MRGLLWAECLKLKRSWGLLLALVLPFALVLFLSVVIGASRDSLAPTPEAGFRVWTEAIFTGWTCAFMPMLVALGCALAWEQESDAGAWKHLLAQPVPRGRHLLAKHGAQVGLLILSHLVLALLLLLSFLLLRALVPALKLGATEPAVLLKMSAWSLLASLPLLGFQNLLSSRLPGLSAALFSGILGMVLAKLIQSGSMGLAPWMQKLCPWGLALQSTDLALGRGSAPLLAFLVLTLALAALGMLDFRFREEQRS